MKVDDVFFSNNHWSTVPALNIHQRHQKKNENSEKPIKKSAEHRKHQRQLPVFHFSASFLGWLFSKKQLKTMCETLWNLPKISQDPPPPAGERGHSVDRLPKGTQPNPLLHKGGLTTGHSKKIYRCSFRGQGLIFRHTQVSLSIMAGLRFIESLALRALLNTDVDM